MDAHVVRGHQRHLSTRFSTQSAACSTVASFACALNSAFANSGGYSAAMVWRSSVKPWTPESPAREPAERDAISCSVVEPSSALLACDAKSSPRRRARRRRPRARASRPRCAPRCHARGFSTARRGRGRCETSGSGYAFRTSRTGHDDDRHNQDQQRDEARHRHYGQQRRDGHIRHGMQVVHVHGCGQRRRGHETVHDVHAGTSDVRFSDGGTRS